MMDTYLMHFDGSKHSVQMSTGTLMRWSNLLKKNINKLRLRGKDAVEALLQDLPEWKEEDIIMGESVCDMSHNLSWDRRFLFREPYVLCPTSHCLVPQRLTAVGAIAKAITSFQAEGSGDNPRKVLENMLRILGPIKAKDFDEMKLEFEQLLYEERNKTQDYQKMQDLQKGIRMVDDMLNVEANTEDVLQRISQNLLQRDIHYGYLRQIAMGLTEVVKVKEAYFKKLRKLSSELKQALDFSLDLELPKPFKGFPNLAFNAVVRHQQTFGKDKFKPKEMHELGCINQAIATYTVKSLKKRKVLLEVHPPFKVMESKMSITIRALKAGGVELVANIVQGSHQNAVATLNISEDKLIEMKRGEDNVPMELGNPGEDPFLTCLSSNFLKEITLLKENVGNTGKS